MDLKKSTDPLKNPSANVLRSFCELERSPFFAEIKNWISECAVFSMSRLPGIRDEVDLRLAQGESRTLLLLGATIKNASQTLAERQQEATLNDQNRNL